MADELKDILTHLSKDIEQEKLLQYLNKDLPDAAQHDIEKEMNDDPFINDAMEGLEQVQDKKNLPFLVQELNHQLSQQLDSRNKRRKQKPFTQQPGIYFTIALLLLLFVLAYVVIRKLL